MGLERRHHQELTFYVPLGSDGRIGFHFRDDNWNSSFALSSTSINDGTWHLVTGIRDVTADQIKIYVDGVFENAVSDISVVSLNTSSPREFAIGANNHSVHGFRGPLVGAMDDIRIYDRALTDDEIRDLFNSPPIAEAGPDQNTECANPNGASVTLDGTGSSDPDDDPLSFAWTGPFGSVAGPTPTVTIPLGTHAITLTVNDSNGGTDTDEVVIIVEDTTPPEITVQADPIVLWPPNHKYHTIDLSQIVTGVADACDANASAGDVVVASATSDEPENGQGDGNTTDDIVIGGDCQSVDLRAERQGGGNGRLYTIHLAVTDASGNEGTASYQVHVPHNKKSGAVDDGPSFTVDGCSPTPLASVAFGNGQQPKVAMIESSEAPRAFSLEQNYPNPFNPVTTIAYSLPVSQHVTVTVFDALGREVATLVNGQKTPGRHEVVFDASTLPSGVYLYRLQAGPYTETKKLLLAK